jgi:hypothetical protein
MGCAGGSIEIRQQLHFPQVRPLWGRTSQPAGVVAPSALSGHALGPIDRRLLPVLPDFRPTQSNMTAQDYGWQIGQHENRTPRFTENRNSQVRGGSEISSGGEFGMSSERWVSQFLVAELSNEIRLEHRKGRLRPKVLKESHPEGVQVGAQFHPQLREPVRACM